MKKLVIFDLDGTLLDTVTDLAYSTNYALEQCGFPIHPVSDYKLFVGNGINKLFERALPAEARTEEHIQKVRSYFIPYYNDHNMDATAPYPGITSLLEALQKKSILLAVASNKYQAATERLVKHYFAGFTFTEVLGQREGIAVKPDPSIVYEILHTAVVAKEDTLYVGDSGVDMQTAGNAGVTSVGVTWGFRPRKELEKNGASFIVDSAEEVLRFVN
ncbi:MAG: HAD family hydrolase [Tannerellaceae bacterium]|nr:HAD family hydrolase [Tannerellaceae bacterium]MCD8264096.1 HAD family hydrolase [Tannerellaceae bacterium]